MRRALLVTAALSLLVPLVALADDDPVITVPADLVVEAQSSAGATVTYTASAVDDRGRPIAVACDPASGERFGFGRTTVTCTARDGGRTSTKRFHITVVDTRPPAITIPPPLQVSTTSRSGKVVAWGASASDVVDGPVAVTCAPASGSLFAVGTTTVTCSAADRRANASSAAFAVTVVLKAKRAARSTTMLSPRPGATVRVAPMLRWRPVRKARFYNVQLFRRGHKMLSAWPSRPRFRLHARWVFQGHEYRLRPGKYTWLVWPAFGTSSSPRYGKLLGLSTFVVRR
jgi:HYR domain-containing protein